jgi:hypothetical protein
MRRALIALIAAVPVFAAAQALPPPVGTIDHLPVTMNIAQCSGAAGGSNRVPQISDTTDLSLTWQVKLDPSITTFSPGTGSAFVVWASTSTFQASNTTGPFSCHLNAANNDITAAKIGPDVGYAASTQATMSAVQIALQSIATAAGVNCATAETINLCVEWLPTGVGSTAMGWATGSINFDTTVPGPPTGFTVAPGEGKLLLANCAAGANTASYIASATDGTNTFWSNEGGCSQLQIGGLTNGTQYTVVLYGLSTAHNPSAASAPVQGPETIPIHTVDFWDHYAGTPGATETGGCHTATGGAGLLGALSLLAALAVARRRKS